MRKVLISMATLPILVLALAIASYALVSPANTAKAASPEYALQCGWDPGGWVPAPCSPLQPQTGGAFLAANTGEVYVPRVENATAREVYPRTLFAYHRAVTNWQRCILLAPDPTICGSYPTFP